MRADALRLAKGIPAWVLRAVILLDCAAMIVLVMRFGLGGLTIGLIGVAGLTAASAPASPAPTLVVLLVALSVSAIDGPPLGTLTLLMVPLVHLLHVCCGLAGVVPADARIQPAALRGPAVRFVAIQAGVFALAGVLALTPTGWHSAPIEVGALLGVTAIPLVLLRATPVTAGRGRLADREN